MIGRGGFCWVGPPPPFLFGVGAVTRRRLVDVRGPGARTDRSQHRTYGRKDRGAL